MTLRRRLDRLEPQVTNAWERAWQDVLEPDETRSLQRKLNTFLDRAAVMTKTEQQEPAGVY